MDNTENIALTEDQKNTLLNAEYKSLPLFSLKGHNCMAKAVKIYDGDTGTFAIYYNSKLYKFKIRLDGLDTPEIKSKDDKEIVAANEAKNMLVEFTKNKLVYIECKDFDKYGRVLGRIYDSENKTVCINDILLEKGYAYIYDGNKKKQFKDWYKGTQ